MDEPAKKRQTRWTPRLRRSPQGYNCKYTVPVHTVPVASIDAHKHVLAESLESTKMEKKKKL
jgi:hypothetical protein